MGIVVGLFLLLVARRVGGLLVNLLCLLLALGFGGSIRSS
jgi:hypothetical protein